MAPISKKKKCMPKFDTIEEEEEEEEESGRRTLPTWLYEPIRSTTTLMYQ